MASVHRCELTRESDAALSKSKSKVSCWSHNYIRPWTTINQNHPKCRQHLISLAAINKEKKRHAATKHWWIIHPYSKIR